MYIVISRSVGVTEFGTITNKQTKNQTNTHELGVYLNVQHFPSTHKALSFIPITTEGREEKVSKEIKSTETKIPQN